MIINKDNYHHASPANVAEAMEAKELEVPLTAFSVGALLQVIEHIATAIAQRGNLRKRVEALEQITQLQSAAIQQLLANH